MRENGEKKERGFAGLQMPQKNSMVMIVMEGLRKVYYPPAVNHLCCCNRMIMKETILKNYQTKPI